MYIYFFNSKDDIIIIMLFYQEHIFTLIFGKTSSWTKKPEIFFRVKNLGTLLQ